MADLTERLAEYIQRVVADAPPLTREQRDKLAVVFNRNRPRFEVSEPFDPRIKR